MSQIEYFQTLGQQEEMEYLLTKEKFYEWFFKYARGKDLLYLLERYDDLTLSQIYLHEVGLSIDSEIKGL